MRKRRPQKHPAGSTRSSRREPVEALHATSASAPPNRWIRLRIGFSFSLFLLAFAAIGHRAFGLQLLHGERYRKQARRQALHTLKIPPKRGPILDRHGNRLAVSVDVPSIYANPRQVGVRATEIAARLAAILDADRFLLAERLSGRRYFVWVKRRVTPRQAAAVKALHLPGVFLTHESRRFYPDRRLAGAVLGFAGMDGRGLEGVEKSFDRWLRGSESTVTGLQDAHGKLVYVHGRPDMGPSAGHTLVLTLDKKLQFITERALHQAVTDNQAKSGSAVVMDPYSGDILAMANVPDFDPNNVATADPAALRNRAVTDAYEPGSVMKIFTMSAAFQQRVTRLGELIPCNNGVIEIGQHKIKDSHPHKVLTPTGIIQKSSNIGATKLALRLGRFKLYRALRLFGFGHRTGLLLPGERSGNLGHWRRWSKAKLSNVSFGQGMTTTTVQLAAALSAIANGGLLYRPRIALAIRDADGRPVIRYQKRWRRVISERSTRIVLKMMRTVVKKGGTGEEAAVPGYSVAGKTGTAQKVAASSTRRAQARAEALAQAALHGNTRPVHETVGYANDLYLASFVGVVPASRPRLVIAIAVDEPQTRHYGGDVAGPAFRQIAQEAMRYLGVPRDQTVDKRSQKRVVPSLVEPPEPAAGPPAPPLPVAAAGPVGNQMPDLRGLGLRSLVTRLRKQALRCSITGTGQVVAQQPAPGAARSGSSCRVMLAPPH